MMKSMGRLLCLLFFLSVLADGLSAQCDRTWEPGAVMELGGPWKMQRGGDGSPADLDDSAWQRETLPGLWGKSPTLKTFKGDVWYRCTVRLEADAPENIALYLGRMEEADEVYFNGVLVGRTGSMTKQTIDIETPRMYSLPSSLWHEGDNAIAIRVRGTSGDAGIIETPRLLPEQQMARKLLLRDVPAIVCSTLYILTATFFGLFFLFFRKRYEHLFFSLFSLFLGCYFLIRTRLRLSLFGSFEVSYNAELILLFALPALFLNYLIQLLKIKKPPVVWAYEGFCAILILGAIFAGAGKWPIRSAWQILILTNLGGLVLAIALILWLVIKNYKSHRGQLNYIVYGFAVLTPAILYDMVLVLANLNLPRLTVFAFLIFLGFISIQLSDSILELYRNLKNQENDLKLLEKKKTASILNIASEFRIISEHFKSAIANLRQGKNGSGLRGASLHLDKFIHDSRLLHLLEGDDYTVRRIRFNLKKLCEDTVTEALEVTGQPKKRIAVEFADSEILADPDLINTALYHLIENALIYTKGKVEAVAEAHGNSVHFAVRDEGPGLSAEQQQNVFLKFERAVDENSEIPGSGIGLAIVRLIAMRLGGNVGLEGGGFFSTFRLSIPLQADAA